MMNLYWGEKVTIATVAGLFITALSISTAKILGWDVGSNPLEILAVFTSYICTIMAVYQLRANYLVGVVTTFLYSILFYQSELYAVAMFNLYLVFSLAYGWWRWGPDDDARPVRDTIDEPLWFLIYPVIGLAVYVFLQVVNWTFGFEMGYVDELVAVLSGIAQIGLDNKHRDSWVVWAVVNVLSIWLFFNSGLYLVTFQYVFFLANTVFGYMMWSKSMKVEAPNAA